MSEFNCEIIEPLLSSYQDGELAAEERAKVETHLSECQACSRILAELDAVSKSVKNLARVKAKKDYSQDIDQLIASRESKIAYFRRPAFWATISVAAAACIVVVAGHLNAPSSNPNVAAVPAEKSAPASAQKQDSLPPDEVATKPLTNARQAKPSAAIAKKEASPSAVTKEEPLPIATAHGGDENSSPAANVLKDVAVDSNQDLIALYSNDENVSTAEELGISTDEDGLYAIKL